MKCTIYRGTTSVKTIIFIANWQQKREKTDYVRYKLVCVLVQMNYLPWST